SRARPGVGETPRNRAGSRRGRTGRSAADRAPRSGGRTGGRPATPRPRGAGRALPGPRPKPRKRGACLVGSSVGLAFERPVKRRRFRCRLRVAVGPRAVQTIANLTGKGETGWEVSPPQPCPEGHTDEAPRFAFPGSGNRDRPARPR